jgi:hypothetical protein
MNKRKKERKEYIVSLWLKASWPYFNGDEKEVSDSMYGKTPHNRDLGLWARSPSHSHIEAKQSNDDV